MHAKVGDGYQGWPEHAPFDKIIVTCSPEKVPPTLVEQLREGGKMVVPVGERYQQTLYFFTKKDGKLDQEALLPTLFVPMTGKAEDNREVLPDPAHPRDRQRQFRNDRPGDEAGGRIGSGVAGDGLAGGRNCRGRTSRAGRLVLSAAA